MTMYSAKVMAPSEVEQFTTTFNDMGELRRILDVHGVAIVTDVIPSTELETLEGEFMKDLMELIDTEALEGAPQAVKDAHEKFLKEGVRAFPLATAELFTEAAGFCVKKGLAQGRFAWRIRQHPRVRDVFRSIFPESEELVGGLDVTFFTPAEQAASEADLFSAHVDQNCHDARSGLGSCDIFQGVVFVWPCESDGSTSTTVVWPGSHKSVWLQMMKDDAFSNYGEGGFHYCDISSMCDRDSARDLRAGWAEHARRAVVPRGGMILWNSRTVHTGWKGGPRLAQPVCMEPVSRRSESERVAKLRLIALGLPSTHYASVGMQHDMILGDPGFMSTTPTPAAAAGPFGGVELPLKPAIRPAGLHEDADLDALKTLVKVKYSLTGMWKPTTGSRELLEASVREEFQRYV
mmetsp:Transcript_7031/g.15138  ORF Transcript_7031/g.15138 Transcript_7031/m.15138 type:complete len:406 (+) Transcript_7031:59-1276(+)